MSSFSSTPRSNKWTAKKIFLTIIAWLNLITIIIGIHVTYAASTWLNILLWAILYPVLAIILYCLVYLKKDSYFSIDRLRQRYQKLHQKKWAIKWVGIIHVFFLPAMLVFILHLDLGLIGYCISTKQFSEHAIVDTTLCHISRPSSLELDVIENHHRFELYFPYSLCRRFPHVAKLAHQPITLYGRYSVLGKIYDGFDYSSTLDIT